MKKIIGVAAIALSIQSANAYTGPQLTWMVAASSAVSVLFTLIEGDVFGDSSSTDESSKNSSSSKWTNKEALLKEVSEDAAAFIANEGQDASSLLQTFIKATRQEHAKAGNTDEATDLDIARALIAATGEK